MKKISILLLLALGLLGVSCEDDKKLDDTRIAEISAPTISLETVAIKKYDATFNIRLADGSPKVRECGIFISSEAEPTLENSTVIVLEKLQEQMQITQTLLPGKTYYACAYALTANNLVKSSVHKFQTESHALTAFLGTRTLSGYSLLLEGENSIQVTISSVNGDATETIATLSGLSSEVGVQLALGSVQMVFNLEAKTVTIPKGQLIKETNYGNYGFLRIQDDGSFVSDDIVGTIDNNTIKFPSMGAVILEGNNAGIPHWAYADITIK